MRILTELVGSREGQARGYIFTAYSIWGHYSSSPFVVDIRMIINRKIINIPCKAFSFLPIFGFRKGIKKNLLQLGEFRSQLIPMLLWIGIVSVVVGVFRRCFVLLCRRGRRMGRGRIVITLLFGAIGKWNEGVGKRSKGREQLLHYNDRKKNECNTYSNGCECHSEGTNAIQQTTRWVEL